ncbi:MAG: GMP reductase [Gammaproteobacteria bacterium]|nr:GMP reductase [Gammaproteobacteria bacterium]
MRIDTEVKLNYGDVLIRPKRSTLGSRKEVDLKRPLNFRNYQPDFPMNVRDPHYNGVPIMAANMDGVGTLKMAQELRKHDMFTCLIKSYNRDPGVFKNFYAWDNTAISTGITESDQYWTDQVLETYPEVKYVCIDVANGYSERFIDFVAKFRERWTDKVIIAGNVVTPDITEELILKGADIVKVGIGPGSVCTTRIKTGVGYPQLSAVIECADAAHGLGGHIIADGGCSTPGDVSKAFGAGADFVMLGGMLSGTDQGGGEVVDGKVEFYGMSSTESQRKNSDVKNYRASEGRVVRVPYKGCIEPIVRDILGGVRSTCTYVGASALKELPKRTTFVRIASGDTHNKIYESSTTGE